jgi:hypothetical protein
MQKAFFIRQNGRYSRVNYSDIIYVEALGNYLKVHCSEKSHLLLMTMKKMMELLPESSFHRIHKSYIISLEQLTAFNFEKAWLGNIVLPIGEQFGRQLSSKLYIAGEDISPIIEKSFIGPNIIKMPASGAIVACK